VLLATSRACVIEANGWPFLVTSSGLLGPQRAACRGGDPEGCRHPRGWARCSPWARVLPCSAPGL